MVLLGTVYFGLVNNVKVCLNEEIFVFTKVSI